MEDKIKINDKTAWFAKELTLATMHEQFMEKFAIECEDNKGKEWYGWKESDSPQKVWDWVEPRLQAIPIEPPVKPDFTEITLNDYEKLGDTFIDAKTDSPLTQWRIIAGMLSSIGFKIIKK